MHATGTRTALTGALMLRLAGGLRLAPVAAWDPGNRTGIDRLRAPESGPETDFDRRWQPVRGRACG